MLVDAKEGMVDSMKEMKHAMCVAKLVITPEIAGKTEVKLYLRSEAERDRRSDDSEERHRRKKSKKHHKHHSSSSESDDSRRKGIWCLI